VPIITYSATSFSDTAGPLLAGTHQLVVAWDEIVWAALSVGKAQLQHLTQYGAFSTFEIIYRAAIIFANLRETPSGMIARSAAYNGLDPSEKGAISYFLGLTMAKLFCGRLLDVPWLMHLDVYREELDPVLLGNSKPDLVGLNLHSEWVVVEAKGRTNNITQSVLQNAKNQAEQVTTILGVDPVLRVGSVTYFNGVGILGFSLIDPARRSEERKLADLPLTKSMLLMSYYRPVRAYLREAASTRTALINKLPYRIASLPDFELSVGLSEEIEPSLVDIPRTKMLPRERNEFIGNDGVLVQLGPIWSVENMRLEPQERRHRLK
jgi:hypothetical protein